MPRFFGSFQSHLVGDRFRTPSIMLDPTPYQNMPVGLLSLLSSSAYFYARGTSRTRLRRPVRRCLPMILRGPVKEAIWKIIPVAFPTLLFARWLLLQSLTAWL